jgi:hypothetical protein
MQVVALFRRNIGHEVVLRLRCSKGLMPTQYYGAFHNRTGDRADIAFMDSDKSVVVHLVWSLHPIHRSFAPVNDVAVLLSVPACIIGPHDECTTACDYIRVFFCF